MEFNVVCHCKQSSSMKLQKAKQDNLDESICCCWTCNLGPDKTLEDVFLWTVQANWLISRSLPFFLVLFWFCHCNVHLPEAAGFHRERTLLFRCGFARAEQQSCLSGGSCCWPWARPGHCWCCCHSMLPKWTGGKVCTLKPGLGCHLSLCGAPLGAVLDAWWLFRMAQLYLSPHS